MPGDAPQNVPAVNLNCEDSSNVKLWLKNRVFTISVGVLFRSCSKEEGCPRGRPF